MTQPQDKMRAEFEAFVKSEEYDLDLQTDAPGGRYIKGCAGFAWDFWQAACAQQSAQSTHSAIDVDALANEIRRVDGSHALGAGALAEALIPFLSAKSQQDALDSARWKWATEQAEFFPMVMDGTGLLCADIKEAEEAIDAEIAAQGASNV